MSDHNPNECDVCKFLYQDMPNPHNIDDSSQWMDVHNALLGLHMWTGKDIKQITLDLISILKKHGI